MPRGDRRGPEGRGPMTGRAAGYCAGYNVAGFENPLPGRGGRGAGFGRGAGGRGWRNRYYATGLRGWERGGRYAGALDYETNDPAADRELEKRFLKNTIAQLQTELAGINKRLEELEKDDAAE